MPDRALIPDVACDELIDLREKFYAAVAQHGAHPALVQCFEQEWYDAYVPSEGTRVVVKQIFFSFKDGPETNFNRPIRRLTQDYLKLVRARKEAANDSESLAA